MERKLHALSPDRVRHGRVEGEASVGIIYIKEDAYASSQYEALVHASLGIARRYSAEGSHIGSDSTKWAVSDKEGGVNLELLSIEQMLAQHPKWQGRTVLVKIANPTRKSDRDLKVIQVEATVEAMNKAIFHGAFRTHSLIPAYISFHPGSTSA